MKLSKDQNLFAQMGILYPFGFTICWSLLSYFKEPEEFVWTDVLIMFGVSLVISAVISLLYILGSHIPKK